MSFTNIKFGVLSEQEKMEACDRYAKWLNENKDTGCQDGCGSACGCDTGCDAGCETGCSCAEGCGCEAGCAASEYTVYNDSLELTASIYDKDNTAEQIACLMQKDSISLPSCKRYIFQYAGDYRLYKNGEFITDTGATEFDLIADVHFSDCAEGCGDCSIDCAGSCCNACGCGETACIIYGGNELHLCGGDTDAWIYNGYNYIPAGTYFIDSMTQSYYIDGMRYTENMWYRFEPNMQYNIDDTCAADCYGYCGCGCSCSCGCDCGCCIDCSCGCCNICGCAEYCGCDCSYGCCDACGCVYKEEAFECGCGCMECCGCDCSYGCC